MRVSIIYCVAILAAAGVAAGRELQQANARCPAGCDTANGGCVADTTTGGYRCIKCVNELVVLRASGTCGCPRGRAGPATAVALASATCSDCATGSYCPGGQVSLSSGNIVGPASFTCGTDLTTLGTRAVSKEQCVNLPGTSFSMAADGTPSAAPCDADTFSPGLRKQPSCTPCSPGMSTDGAERSTSSSACKAPPGSFLKAPGVVALCPRGEYKSGFNLDVKCTVCPAGSTTAAEGSDASSDCNQVLPGYYATEITEAGIIATNKCPQDFYCPGGTVTSVWSEGDGTVAAAQVTACPNSKWTKTPGAESDRECLVPPGYELVDPQGDIAPCSPGSHSPFGLISGSYRAGWVFDPVTCTSCGSGGILSEPVDAVQRFRLDGSSADPVRVAASAGSCYIPRGWGIYSTPQGGFRAQPCGQYSNNYGVAGKSNGLTVNPCRDCPSGMVTNFDWTNSGAHYDIETGGFYNPKACVTKAGFGYNGRVATKCQQGYFNAEDSYDQCTKCPFGKTTKASPAADGSDQATIDDCWIAPGYGDVNGVVKVCPVGTFNNVVRTSNTEACSACPDGTTTPDEGASLPVDQSCNVCAAGWGSADANSCTSPSRCGGGSSADAEATYGADGRAPSASACVNCPVMEADAGFVFNFGGSTNSYAPPTVARLSAESTADCLAGMAQLQDGLFYVPEGSAATGTSAADNIIQCANECLGAQGCMFATWDYLAEAGSQCLKVWMDGSGDANTVVALKAVPAGSVLAAAGKTTKANALVSGRYSFYGGTAGNFGAVLDEFAGNSLEACQEACDSAPECIGFEYNAVSEVLATDGCKLLKGDETVDTGKRTLVKADIARLNPIVNSALLD